MATHQSSTNTKTYGVFASIALIGLSSLLAVDFTEDFNGTALNTAIWEKTGPRSATVASGYLTINNDGGNWASGDISTQARYFIPPPGETTTIVWTMGPGTVTTTNPVDDGRTLRYQVGIHSANEPSIGREHWVNTTGGVWIDLDNINPNDTTTASGFVASANDTKPTASAGNNLSNVTLNWNWTNANHVLKLAFTDTQYTWYDGETAILTDTWSNAGIDTEFDNGFRVLALGMHFNQGRGTTSFDKIEILNAFEPPALLTSFGASKLQAFSGQKINLNWLVGPNTTVTIDQGIGNVTPLTTSGAGQIQVTLPTFETPTTYRYKLTVTDGVETAERTIPINVIPLPEVSTESFSDDFDGFSLDTNRWQTLGDQSFTVADSKITWAADGTNWSHGEITTIQAYPVPTPGNPTIITWNYGPGSVTTDNGDGTAIRPLMGIYRIFTARHFAENPLVSGAGGS